MRVLFFDMMTDGHGLKNWSALARSEAFRGFVGTPGNEVSALVSATLRERLMKELADCPAWQKVDVRGDAALEDCGTGPGRRTGFQAFCRHLRGGHFDAALVMYGDIACFSLPSIKLASPRTRLASLFFRPSLHYRASGFRFGKREPWEAGKLATALKHHWVNAMARCGILARVGLQDEEAVGWMRRRGIDARRFPAPPALSEYGRLPATGNARLCFTLFGGLSGRKGVFAVLDVFGDLPAAIKDRVTLKLVGRAAKEDRGPMVSQVDRLRADGLDIWFEDRFIDHSEIRGVYEKADVMLLLYKGYLVQTSGVLVQAAAYAKPVIATDAGWVGHSVKKHRLGLAVDTEDPAALAGAVERFVRGEVAADAAAAIAFAKEHDPEIFGRAMIDLVAGDGA